MFREIASFEVRRQIRQGLPWVFFAVFFLMAFGDRASENIQLLGDTSSLLRNAPFIVVEILVFMTILGTLVAASVVATSVQRDYALNTYPLLFAMPMPRRSFLLGRFFGSLAVGTLVMGGAALGVMAGAQGPWHDPARVGPFSLAPYLKALVVFVLPNLFVTGSLLFAVATLTRSLRTTYAAVVFLLMSYGTAGALLTGGFSTDLSYKSVAALADPFGFSTFRVATRYWTPVERNTLDLPFAGALLANRALWLAVGALALAFTAARFRPEEPARAGKPEPAPAEAPGERATAAGLLPTPVCTFSAATAVRQYLHQTRLELADILHSLPFHVMLLIGCANLVLQSFAIDQLYGTPIQPLTTVFLRVIQFSFPLWVFIITTFFSGELAWRERSVRLDPVYDALPVVDAVPFAAKTTALVLLQAVMLLAATLTLMATQAARGYYHFEPLLYAEDFFGIVLLGFSVCAVLAMALQVLAGNKYLAFLFMVLCFISPIALPSFGFEHDLLQLPFRFYFPHSDLNGFGHFVRPAFWLGLHWALAAALLGLLGLLFWVRGTEAGLRSRLRAARQRLTRARLAALAAGLLALAVTDGWVLYNTTVLNEYLTTDERDARRAEYEKKYRSEILALALPRIAEAHTDVDIFPAQRAVRLRGRYVLENRAGTPIQRIPLTVPRPLEVARMSLTGARLTDTDRTHGVYSYEMDPPLAPGARAVLDFDVSRVERGFKNGIEIADTALIYNGSFLRGGDFLPHVGYRSSVELTDGVTRRRFGLPAARAWPEPEDAASREVGYFGPEADWVRTDTVVSTSADQIAIAPGTLAREWTDGGRRYFRYEMERPVAGGEAFLSGRYEVARDRWRDVAIEVFYHPAHRFNVDGMIRAVKRSLEVFSESFGAYPHRLVRIVEFPRYDMSAESYPTTIPFSESAGFVARVDETTDVDPLFHVTAHEMAHQWWGNAVVPARARGGELLVESLAEYSATRALEKEKGPEMVRRLMRYEREDYLSKRGAAANPEVPLSRVEGQHYIRYNKGALAFEALHAYLGEATMNRVLGEFARATMYQGPPYPVADDLLARFKAAAPDRYRSLVDDLFNSITLWDNRAVQATWEPAGAGRARVTLTVEARKRRTDEKGQERDVPMDDWVELAVFGQAASGGGADSELYREKHLIRSGRQTISVVVEGKPRRAAIDPDGLLIDRNLDDNVVPVEMR